MKIGILAYRQYPYISANTAIAYSIGNQLSGGVDSCEVIYIGYKQEDKQNDVFEYEGSKIRFFNNDIEPKLNRVQNYIHKILGDKVRLNKYSKGLSQIVTEEKVDAIVCCIAPVDDALIVYYANLKIPVILYQLDPYYNLNDEINIQKKKQFIEIVNKCKHVFTTELLYEEYKNDSDFDDIISKISVVQFPKIDKQKYTSTRKEKDEKITFLYAGTLYKGIRNPQMLIELKDILPNNFEVVFCGGCDDLESEEVLKRVGIKCLGYLSQEELLNEYKKADILINIGNSVKNQMGSKIIDYISTGKPILNIYQFKNCPTIKALEKYDNVINMHSEELKQEITKNKMEEFCKNNKRKIIPWEEIYNNYNEYTPEYVSKQIQKSINE